MSPGQAVKRMPTFVLVACALILAVIAARKGAARHRRGRALGQLGRSRRLRYARQDVLGVLTRYHNLGLLRRGHSLRVSDLLYGLTDGGAITTFQLTAEFGFGAARAQRSWWVVVLETERFMKHWTSPAEGEDQEVAQKPAASAGSDDSPDAVVIDPARIRPALAAAPPDSAWEARGKLLAVACRYDGDPATVGRLIEAINLFSQPI